MKKLKILKDNHPKLKKISKEVIGYSEDLQIFIDNMKFTLDSFNGKAIGLAAPQVGRNERIIMIKFPDLELIMINPKISWDSRATVSFDEKCLSVKETVTTHHRSEQIFVEYTTPELLKLAPDLKESIKLSDLRAICVQHEIDHLNGILITDYKD